MKRWVPWVASAALVAVGGGAVYTSTIGLDDTQAATLDYITQTAEQGDVRVTSAATGTVTSAESYTLAFGVEPSLDGGSQAANASWSVLDVLVSAGDHVSAGQVLAVADTTDLEADLADLQAGLGRAELNLTEAEDALASAPDDLEVEIDDAILKVQSLNLQLDQAEERRDEAASGSTTKAQAKLDVAELEIQLQEAKALRNELKGQRDDGFPEKALAVTEAELAVADLEGQVADLEGQIELATIVAPVDGLVASVDVTAGFDTASNSAIVLDSETLEVVASVVESDVGSLVVGQSATVSIDAVELDVTGVVTSVVPTTTGSTSSVVSYPVTVMLTDPDPSVLSGMGTDVEIVIDEATGVLSVPVTALDGRNGDYTVQVVSDGGSPEVRAVTVGLVTETTAEIQSGLAAGEEVVVGTATERSDSEDDSSESAFDMGAMNAMGGGGGERPAGPPPSTP